MVPIRHLASGMALPTPISCGGFPDRFIDRPAVDVDGSNTYATADVSRVDLAMRLARWPFVSEDTSAFITALLDGRVIPRAQLEEMMDRVDWGVAGPGLKLWPGPGRPHAAVRCHRVGTPPAICPATTAS